MKRNYSIYILLFAATMLLVSMAQPALALEVTYPKIGTFEITSDSTLLQYIEYFFAFAIAISGILAVVILVISGLQILVFAGSPEKINEAKEGLWAAVLGIVLLFASFIIMMTINPNLVNPSTQALPQSDPDGVFLDVQYTQITFEGFPNPGRGPCTEARCKKTFLAPQENPSIGETTDFSYNTGVSAFGMATMHGDTATSRIRYRCTPPTSGKDGTRLMVSVYANKNFQIDRIANGVGGNVRTYFLKCNKNDNNFVIVDAGVVESYKWEYEKPGVYFYLKENCQENPVTTGLTSATGASYTSINSKLYTGSSIIEPFDCEVGGGGDDWGEGNDTNTNTCQPRQGVLQVPTCMRIVNSEQEQYGTILNQSEAAVGACTEPILNKDIPTGNEIIKEVSKPVPTFNESPNNEGPKFAYVFKHVPADKYPSGEIRFESAATYNEVLPNDFTLENKRLYHLPDLYGGSLNYFIKTRYLLNPNTTPLPEECDTSKECLKFIRSPRTGAFRTVLYSEDENGFRDNVCQVYTCQENNFGEFVSNNNRWIFNSRRKVYDMFIIPMPKQTCDRS